MFCTDRYVNVYTCRRPYRGGETSESSPSTLTPGGSPPISDGTVWTLGSFCLVSSTDVPGTLPESNRSSPFVIFLIIMLRPEILSLRKHHHGTHTNRGCGPISNVVTSEPGSLWSYRLELLHIPHARTLSGLPMGQIMCFVPATTGYLNSDVVHQSFSNNSVLPALMFTDCSLVFSSRLQTFQWKLCFWPHASVYD